MTPAGEAAFAHRPEAQGSDCADEREQPGAAGKMRPDRDGHHFFLTFALRPYDGGTEQRWRQTLDTIEHHPRLAAFVARANEQNLDRLAAEVERGRG